LITFNGRHQPQAQRQLSTTPHQQQTTHGVRLI
jgi:hypothetical protein